MNLIEAEKYYLFWNPGNEVPLTTAAALNRAVTSIPEAEGATPGEKTGADGLRRDEEPLSLTSSTSGARSSVGAGEASEALI